MRRAGSFILIQTSKEVEDPRESSDSNQNHIETRWNTISAKMLFQQKGRTTSNLQQATPNATQIRKQATLISK